MTGVNFPGLEKEVCRFESECRAAESSDSLEHLKNLKGRYFRNTGIKGDSLHGSAVRGEPDFMIDLNSADTLELQRLKGIGPSFARRIVGYRTRLGGYVEARQLLEVFGLDSVLYKRIKGHLMVKTDSVQTINLNTATFKDLMRHPYFPYELTRSLVLYRQKNKVFRSLDDLRSVPGMNDSLFMKIRPYVCMGKQ
jgi:DNA uptake protein ComE-like DNA-binding protein